LAEKDENCKIEFLDLCGNQNLDDEILKCFSNKKSLKNLKYLNLSWCSKITDVAVESLAPQLDSLELLSLHGILGITDKTVEYLHSNESLRNRLQTLDLYGCANVKNKDHQYLIEKFPKLTCFKHHF
jgi:F-box and leucine-rich repeat protein 2/20